MDASKGVPLLALMERPKHEVGAARTFDVGGKGERVVVKSPTEL